MTKSYTMFHWIVTLSNTSRRPWTHFKVHTTALGYHAVWGSLSAMIENWTLEVHPVCAQCSSADIGERRYGDEGVTYCQSCRSVEQGYKYVNLIEYEKAN